jgi:hypothetical protein
MCNPSPSPAAQRPMTAIAASVGETNTVLMLFALCPVCCLLSTSVGKTAHILNDYDAPIQSFPVSLS